MHLNWDQESSQKSCLFHIHSKTHRLVVPSTFFPVLLAEQTTAILWSFKLALLIPSISSHSQPFFTPPKLGTRMVGNHTSQYPLQYFPQICPRWCLQISAPPIPPCWHSSTVAPPWPLHPPHHSLGDSYPRCAYPTCTSYDRSAIPRSIERILCKKRKCSVYKGLSRSSHRS